MMNITIVAMIRIIIEVDDNDDDKNVSIINTMITEGWKLNVYQVCFFQMSSCSQG